MKSVDTPTYGNPAAKLMKRFLQTQSIGQGIGGGRSPTDGFSGMVFQVDDRLHAQLENTIVTAPRKAANLSAARSQSDVGSFCPLDFNQKAAALVEGLSHYLN
jgi:hypothetical protein